MPLMVFENGQEPLAGEPFALTWGTVAAAEQFHAEQRLHILVQPKYNAVLVLSVLARASRDPRP